MTEPTSKWQTQELATAFLKGVRAAIPAADLQLRTIVKIIQLWRPDPSVILDLGCGDGILGHLVLSTFPSARGVFADFSDPMLDAARENLAGMSQAAVLKTDFAKPQWVDAVASYQPFDVIISGFAIHHQPDDRKRELYREIHDLLSPGGVFLNLEHVASCTPAGETLFDEFFIDHLHEFHARRDPAADRQAVSETYYTRPDKEENILAPVEQQCRWLREIGFDDVDCFFKVFELALFGGRKTERQL